MPPPRKLLAFPGWASQGKKALKESEELVFRPHPLPQCKSLRLMLSLSVKWADVAALNLAFTGFDVGADLTLPFTSCVTSRQLLASLCLSPHQ